MGVELKPCPFCGGTAHVEQPGTRRQSCVVECDSCGIRHESGDEGSMCGTAWNRREGEADRIQQQALEYVSLQAQCDEHLARIAELEKERDALKADAEGYRFIRAGRAYIEPQDSDGRVYVATSRERRGYCKTAEEFDVEIALALQAEKETR